MPTETPGREYLLAEVKKLVSNGGFARDTRIDLQSLADRFKVSVTPIRDILHQLVGERLVSHHPFGGFQVVTPDAVALQHLYAWNGQHLLSALHLLSEPVIRQTILPIAQTLAATEAPNSLFLIERFAVAVGEATGNSEFVAQIEAANDRLHRPRLAEMTLFGDRDRELQSLVKSNGLNVQKNVRRRLLAYHRRRVEQAPQIAALIG